MCAHTLHKNITLFLYTTTVQNSTELKLVVVVGVLWWPPTTSILSGDGLTTKHISLPLESEPTLIHSPSKS